MAAAVAAEVERPAFAVLDALGLCRLSRRDPTLGGRTPLRAVQACAPLLAGNAFGFQVVLDAPIEVRRRLGRLSWEVTGPRAESVARAAKAAVPRLVAQGFVGAKGGWAAALSEGLATSSGRAGLRLWTGLLVRCEPGTWLRLSGAANRRNRLFEVAEIFVAESDALVPLVVDLELRKEAPDRVVLEGEIACLAPLAPGASIATRRLEEAREVGEAHVAFYDAAYFAEKRAGDSTRKYRRMLREEDASPAPAGPCDLVTAGPAHHEVQSVGRVVGPRGPEALPPEAPRVEQVDHACAVSFRATFDGLNLAVEPDRKQLAEGASAVERAWAAAFGEGFVKAPASRGAMLYLTKYFTPHPPGEPHFFVKPWAFFRTPPGWSTLVEGAHGPGYDVLRGVVSTDSFFATPAVFEVYRVGVAIEVAAGAPLVRLTPVPRWLLAAGHRRVEWRDYGGA